MESKDQSLRILLLMWINFQKLVSVKILTPKICDILKTCCYATDIAIRVHNVAISTMCFIKVTSVATCGAETAYPSGAHGFIPGI